MIWRSLALCLFLTVFAGCESAGTCVYEAQDDCIANYKKGACDGSGAQFFAESPAAGKARCLAAGYSPNPEKPGVTRKSSDAFYFSRLRVGSCVKATLCEVNASKATCSGTWVEENVGAATARCAAAGFTAIAGPAPDAERARLEGRPFSFSKPGAK